MGTKADFTSKPPLGGWLPSIELSARQAEVMDAIADEIIPGGDGFPYPSNVGVTPFIARYVAPTGEPAKWFPFFSELDFKARLDGFGHRFISMSSQERVAELKLVERSEAVFFGRLRDMVYFAYYSTAEVVGAINRELEAGKDYRLTPQPYGYPVGLEDWDVELLSRARGSYLRTEEVVRVDLRSILS